MSSSPLGIPATHIPETTEVQEVFEPIDASRIATYLHQKIGAQVLQDLRGNPSNIIKGFEEIELSIDESPQNYFYGRVPSSLEKGKWELIRATVFSPGKVVRGLHRAISVIKPLPEPKSLLQIEAAGRYVQTEKQLQLFEIAKSATG